MYTPKRDVSWLECFPPDIWAYFVSYLPGEQLERLLMTGARLLSLRLKSPTVVKLIKLGEDFMSFKSCSKFLSDYPYLEELWIHSCHDQWSNDLGLMSGSIPSGVRQLELSGFWSKAAINSFVGNLDLARHLPCLQTLDIKRLHISEYDWMAHTPQSLTDLRIHRWDGTVELPRSLLHFNAFYIVLSISTFVSKLPPSLESFATDDLVGVELLLPIVPPSTRELYLGWTSKFSDEAKFNWSLLELPKSLTEFSLRKILVQFNQFRELDFATNPELISLLPSTLTLLDTSSLPASMFHLLPRNIKTLYFETSESQTYVVSKIRDENGVLHEIPSIPFDSLPRSITSLQLTTFYDEPYFCGPPTWKYDGPYFPPQLTSLTFPDFHFSPETTKLFPSTLTYLEIGNMCERVCEHLPNGLKTLIVKAALVTPNLIKFLPKRLTHLQLALLQTERTGQDFSYWFDYKTGERSSLSTNNYEPLIPKSFEWKNPYSLPSTLTYLELRIPDDLGDSFLLHQPLSNLLELKLTTLPVLSIPHLPPQLTRLHISKASHISGNSFQSLPKTLTDLILGFAESIFDSDIQHLPRSLKRVSLHDAIHLTNSCIADLPPHLEWLHLSRNALITPDCFHNLPYSLRSKQTDHSVGLSKWAVRKGMIYSTY